MKNKAFLRLIKVPRSKLRGILQRSSTAKHVLREELLARATPCVVALLSQSRRNVGTGYFRAAITYTIIITLLFQNIALASYSNNPKNLSSSSLFKSTDKQSQLQASMICETIERRARYGKPLEHIYLNDILLWARSSEAEFNGCRFSILPYEIRIYLPLDNTIVRYFNPLKIGSEFHDIIATRKISSRLHRQIICAGKTFLSDKPIKKPNIAKPVPERGLTMLESLVGITALFAITFTFMFSFVVTLMLTADTTLSFTKDIIKLLPSLGTFLGGFGISWWVLKQIEYGITLWKKEPAYDLLKRVVPPLKEQSKKSIKFAEYNYKVITGQPIKAITLGINLSDSERDMLVQLLSIKDDSHRYMLYYNVEEKIGTRRKHTNKLAGIITIRERGRGIISVDVDWAQHDGKRQLSEDFVITELANLNPVGIIFLSSDIDPEIIDRLLPNHSIADKKETAKRLKENVFSKLGISDDRRYTFFAMDKQDFRERRHFYFGSFKFSSLWKMAEIDHWIYAFANGLFFALVFSSIFAHAEAIKVLAEYTFFEEYINLILTVIVAPLAARSIAKVIRLRWDPVRSRHGRRGSDDIWLSVTQNMRMGWRMIGTFKIIAYTRIFLSALSLLLIPAIGVAAFGISSAYIYLGLLFLKLIMDHIISAYEQRYYKEIAETAILFNEAAKREGYAENFHNIDSTSEVFRELIYACGLLIGYGIFSSSILSIASIPLAILAVIAISISSFLVPIKGRDYKNYLKIWGRGFTLKSAGKVLLADGITLSSNPENPLVVHPRPVPVTGDFSILPWIEQLGVVIECAPRHMPNIKFKNPKLQFGGLRTKKGKCIIEWPDEKLKIELVSREKPLDIRDIIIEHKPDGGCIIRFYPKKNIKPSKGSPATLLQYMHNYRIFSNNPKRSREVARQRGGNDSQRTIQRELKVLKAVGLVEGDRNTGYYLPDWLKSIKIEDIISENPELNIADPDKKQIEAVKRRIRSRSQTALFTMLNGVLRNFMPVVNASLVAVVLRHYPHKDASFAKRLYDVIQRSSGLSALEKLKEFNRLYPDDFIDNIPALAAEADELKKALSSEVGISSTGQKLLELFQHNLAFTISVDYPDYIKEVMGSNPSLLNAQGLLVDTLGNTGEADYDKFSYIDKVLGAYTDVKNVFLVFDAVSEIKQARETADRLKLQGKRVHVIGVVYPMSSETAREALKSALRQAGYSGSIDLDTLNLPDQSFESLSQTLEDAGADIVLSGLSNDLPQVMERVGKLVDANIIARLAYQKGKPVVFSLPKNPGKKYHLIVQDDFVSTGIFRDANEVPKHMIYVTTTSRDKKQISYPVGMATGIDIDKEGALNLEWVVTFDYDAILKEVERFRTTQLKNDTPLFAAMGIYIVYGERGEFHGQIKFLWAYLDSKLQDKSDEAVLGFFGNAPRNLRRTGIGTAISEFLTSFAPIGSRIKFLIANEETKEALWRGEIFENTLIGRWWRKLGYDKVGVSPGGQDCVLEKRRLSTIESIWEEPDNLGEYCIKTKDVERRDVPKYGDKDYWIGGMGITVQDLVNLGLIHDFGTESKLSHDAFPLFTDMPEEVQDIVLQRLTHPYSTHKDILRGRESIEALLATADNEKLDGIVDLINSYSEVKDKYYKELKRLRSYHYPHRYYKKVIGRFSEPYPEVSQALIYLGQIIMLLSELYEMLPENGSPVLQRWKRRIKDTLNHPELKPFIDSGVFLRHVSNIDNPYVFLNKDELNNLYSRTEDWKKGAKISEVRAFQERLGSLELEALKREFLGLAGELSNLWELHVPIANKMKKGSKGDKHPFLRQFPFGIMKDPLANIIFYSRIAQLVSQKGYRFADINQPRGTIRLTSYKNPLINEKGGRVEVVPVSINLGGDKNALLLSGPNMGGKTTTARGIGAAVLLTQIGMPIPGGNHELAVFRNIYTIFPRPEQLQSGYGYFGTLVKELTELCKKAGEGDLVILDEVPTGTDYKELVAIATVLVEDLIKSGATVIVTGHLKKSFELLAERTGQQPYMHTVKENDGQAEPDFNLVPGIAKHSYAIELTKKAGFPSEITDLSRLYYRIITEGVDAGVIPAPEPMEKSGEEEKDKIDATGMVEVVLSNLYPFENFVFPKTQKRMINKFMNSVLEELQDAVEGKIKPEKDYGEQRLKTTAVFLSQGMNYLNKLANFLSVFTELLKEEDRWVQPRYNHSVNMKKIGLVEETIKILLSHLEALKEDPQINEVISSLGNALIKLNELREEYKDKDGKGLDKAALDKLNTQWMMSWTNLIKGDGKLLQLLELIDEYNGIAKGIIKHKLKASRFSDRSGVFSLKNSKPLFPNEFPSSNPFIERAVEQSFQIDPSKPILVLTGPNSSGKTVLMFNSYMNALMAKRGFYVSGDLEMSRFSNVFAFFGGRNDVTSGKSYFLNILNRYSEIIRKVTPDSLVILDELHGTDNFELAAIQLAVLHYLRRLNVIVIFNTHIRDGLRIAADRVGFSIWKTDVEYYPKDQRVKPKFTVSPDPGLTAKSYGLAVAEQWLSSDQVRRAREILSLLDPDGSTVQEIVPHEPSKKKDYPIIRMTLERKGARYVLTQMGKSAKYEFLWDVLRSINHQIDNELDKLRRLSGPTGKESEHEHIMGVIYNLRRFRDSGALDAMFKERNRYIDNDLIDRLLNLISGKNIIDALGIMYRFLSLRHMDEPEFYTLNNLLGQIKRLLEEAEDAAEPDIPLIERNLRFLKNKIIESNLIWEFVREFRNRYEEGKLIDITREVNPETVFNSLFLEYSAGNSLVRGSPSYWRTVLYKSCFIPFRISLPNDKKKKIINPLFEALTDWSIIQSINNFSKPPRKLRSNTSNLLISYSGKGKTNFAGLSSEDKESLRNALLKDYNLNDTDKKILSKCTEDPNVSCGTICESGHEGAYNALDEQLKRQFEELRRILGITEEKDLTEEEADRALAEYAKRFGIETTIEQLQEYRRQIKETDEALKQINIFFSIPETETSLFWVGEDYAGGHFNWAGTRIHISLPIILRKRIEAGIDIAMHELEHIKGKGHGEDDGSRLVAEIAKVDIYSALKDVDPFMDEESVNWLIGEVEKEDILTVLRIKRLELRKKGNKERIKEEMLRLKDTKGNNLFNPKAVKGIIRYKDLARKMLYAIFLSRLKLKGDEALFNGSQIASVIRAKDIKASIGVIQGLMEITDKAGNLQFSRSFIIDMARFYYSYKDIFEFMHRMESRLLEIKDSYSEEESNYLWLRRIMRDMTKDSIGQWLRIFIKDEVKIKEIMNYMQNRIAEDREEIKKLPTNGVGLDTNDWIRIGKLLYSLSEDIRGKVRDYIVSRYLKEEGRKIRIGTMTFSRETVSEAYFQLLRVAGDFDIYKGRNFDRYLMKTLRYVGREDLSYGDRRFMELVRGFIQGVVKTTSKPPTFEEIRERFPGIVSAWSLEAAEGLFGGGEKAGGGGEDLGLCVTGDTLLPIVQVSSAMYHVSCVGYKPIVDVKPGDYVLSLNEETQQIEPHRINGLLDMGTKPVYRLTTASGRSIKTTANHPYLTRNGWVKVSGLKTGDEIGVPRQIGLLSISPITDLNTFNENNFRRNIKGDAIVSNTETMSTRRKINKWFSTNKRISQTSIVLQLLINTFLNFFRQGLEITFSPRGKLDGVHNRIYTNPNSCSIFLNGTQPFFFASAIALFKESINFGLRGNADSILSISHPAGFTDLLWYSSVDNLSTNASSILDSTSRNANVSKIKSCGVIPRSTITAALESFPSLNTALGEILLKGISLADFNFAGKNFTLSPPTEIKYNTLISRLSRLFSSEVEAAELPLTYILSPDAPTWGVDRREKCGEDIIWDRIVSIEYFGYEHVYDIEVEGTHNFIGNGIFAHNTYIDKEEEEDGDDPNVSCGTICESGHEGSYNTLDEQLKRQFDELRRLLRSARNDSDARNLTEEEADRALVEYAKRFGIGVTYEQLQEFRRQIKEIEEGLRSIDIFFSIPETGTKLFWVGDDYAGGHFNGAGTRIHISLPIILGKEIKAGIAIAKHELAHIQGRGHEEDEGFKLVKEIASIDVPIDPHMYNKEESQANNPIKSLLFDLDGTLMPTMRHISFRALAWSYAKYKLGNTEEETVKGAHEMVTQTRDRIAKAQRGTVTVSVVRDLLGITLEQQKEGKRIVTIPELKKVIKKDERQIELFERLSRQYKLGIVTNENSEVTDCVLTLLGIRQFFNIIITPEEVGKKKKPDPIFLKTAAERLGIPYNQCVSIGDLYPQDGKPAEILGMHYIEVSSPVDLITNLETKISSLIKTLAAKRFINTVKSMQTKEAGQKTILALDTDIGNMTQFGIDELLKQIRDVSSLLGDIEFVAGPGETLTRLIDDAKEKVKTDDLDVIVVTKKEKEDFDSSYHIVRTDDSRLDLGSYVPILELLTFALLINLEDNDILLREIYKEMIGNELTDELKEQIKNGIFAIPLPPTERISSDFYNTSVEILKSA